MRMLVAHPLVHLQYRASALGWESLIELTFSMPRQTNTGMEPPNISHTNPVLTPGRAPHEADHEQNHDAEAGLSQMPARSYQRYSRRSSD